MFDVRGHLLAGHVIPAHPLALTPERKLDERRQRALTRYYASSGAGGVAVGVHTTQFAIREPRFGLLRPVLELAAETAASAVNGRPFAKVAGVCGRADQASREAALAASLGYNACLLSLSAWRNDPDDTILEHCRAISDIMPVIGFYLQPEVGGRVLSYAFWRRFAEIEKVVAIKIAPFHRYRTLDVVRAVAESGRLDIALYTGNDDNIVVDLLTPFRFHVDGRTVDRRIVGGLLGHWAVWTRRAVSMLEEAHRAAGAPIAPGWLARAASVTDSNAAIFDAANGYSGCIAGIHEVLRRQGMLAGTWCLDPDETLSPGQAAEIDRVCAAYPDLNDDEFVAAHRDDWMR